MDRSEMKTAISYRNVEKLSRPGLEDLIGQLTDRRLTPHLSHFPSGLVRLQASLERSRHRSLYRVRLRLVLPGATLACGNDAQEPENAIELSIAAMKVATSPTVRITILIASFMLVFTFIVLLLWVLGFACSARPSQVTLVMQPLVQTPHHGPPRAVSGESY